MSKTGKFRWASTEQQEQFWRFVQLQDDQDACWLWSGARQPSGYGSYTLNGCKTTAHRIAYMLVLGPLEETEFVRHKCDVPACCNPRHLEAGSQQENIRDMRSRGRGFDIPPMRGASHPRAKLSNDQVREIRRLYAETDLSQQQIADQFEIVQNHVSRLIRGEHKFDA